MNSRSGLLMLAVIALASLPGASWSAQPVVGKDYYSVQLASGKSAADLQKSLALLAGQPYARIDQRGAVYILRVGFWESREEAVQVAQTLLPNFRNAYARIASYRPDAIVASAGSQSPGTSSAPFRPRAAVPVPGIVESTSESPSRASSVPPPVTAAVTDPLAEPTRSQAQVLDLRRQSQANLLPDPELQQIYPLPPPPREVAPPPREIAPPPREVPPPRADAPAPSERSRAQPSPPRGPNEEPLWALLSKQRYAEIETEVSRLRKAYPRWRPPARLIALKTEGEVRRRIEEAVDTKNWKNVLAFARQYPGQFSCAQLEFMLGLAEAYYSQGETARSLAVIERIIPACPNATDRINSLQRVNALFTLEIMQQLLQRELKGGRRDAEQQVRFERLLYDFHMRGLAEAMETKDRERAMAIIETADRMPEAQRNARHANQVGWVYLELGQDEIAIKRFEAALSWITDSEMGEDARRGLALANFRLSQRDDPESLKLRLRRLDAAEAALARSDPDDANNRELLGEIFLLRAGDAFESKDYGQCLAYLDQAEALGRGGRDVMMRRAWVHYQRGDDARAVESFTSLYRDKPDKDIAEALVFSMSRGGRWSQLDQLAQSLGGPLAELAEAASLQRYYDGKSFLKAEHVFPGNFAELDNIASTGVAVGAMVRYKPGSDGTSHLRVLHVPVVEGVKVFGGVHEFRLQVDRVDLSSGHLPAGAMIGSFPAAGIYVAEPTTQLTNSLEPYLSYRHQGAFTTYAGLGLTPSDGVIASAPIGNLGFTAQLGRGTWGAELFSQPVRETMLSYTGIVDPYTGQSWGRVRRSGALVSGATSLTDSLSVSGGLQAAHLGGDNVANNQSLKVNLSLAKNLTLPGSDLFTLFDYITVGPNVTYESYRKNLGQFTFGQGGYYSPQRVIMVGAAGQFLTREGRQYMIRGGASLGRFSSRSAASPCFPLGNPVLPLNPDCVTGFAASSATGNSYSAEAVGVRRLSDHLQLGGGVIWRRSPQYDDKLGLVFLRYLFDPRPAVMSTDVPDAVFQRLY